MVIRTREKFKWYLNRSIKTINIKGLASLANYAINHKIIAITNCYQTIVDKASYLITTNTKNIFSVS